MASTLDSLPTDLAAAHAIIIAQREALIVAKAQNAEAEARHRALLIEQMKFTIAKLRHQRFGPSSERSALLEQGMSHFLLNIAARSLPRLTLGGGGLASKDAVS